MKGNSKIGLFGYGCVGRGLHDVLENSRGFRADIGRICVKDRKKPRRLDLSRFTYDATDILDDPSIDLVVELIDDPEEALHIVTRALENGKNVVSANKRMVAENMEELIALQEKTGSSILYEASACASIPIIRNLEEYYDNELLLSLQGIFNGSTNYMLTRMYDEGTDFDSVLDEARAKGYAEANPWLDVDGWDATYKLCIITAHAYGLVQDPGEIFHYGIRHLSSFDMRYAREKGFKIKLVPYVGRVENNLITSWVLPSFVRPDRYLYNVDNEYNGVIAEAAFADRQFFYGKGAGGHATGMAVLSDISANSYGYRYEYKKRGQRAVSGYTRDVDVDIWFRYREKESLDLIGFEEIFESFSGREWKWVTGRVSLQKLYDIRDKLNDMNAFFCLLEH